MTTVAEELANTPAIVRKSYVHSAIVEAFEDGTLARLRKSPRSGQRKAEMLARLVRRPWDVRAHHARTAALAAVQTVHAAVLQRRLSRLARLTASAPPMPLVPLLTPQAAAVRTDQALLE